MAITSADERDTEEEIIEKVRKVINAKEEEYKVDKIRKARDRKIILGCETRQEVERIRYRLLDSSMNLKVDEVRNKDPLIILRDLMAYNTDEEIIKAIRTQNKHLFRKWTKGT